MGKASRKKKGKKQAAPAAQHQPQQHQSPNQEQRKQQLAALGVKELKRLAKERGVDTTGLLEKQEFVAALAAAPASVNGDVPALRRAGGPAKETVKFAGKSPYERGKAVVAERREDWASADSSVVKGSAEWAQLQRSKTVLRWGCRACGKVSAL